MNEGSVFGWPYCFYDGMTNKMILAPEYGGDGKAVGRCAQYEAPVAGFPAHYAPVDLQFFTATTLPAHYRGGAFVVRHGPWFADGFKGKDPLMSPSEAAARPNGLALGPDGSLYITESVKGKTWRVFHRG